MLEPTALHYALADALADVDLPEFGVKASGKVRARFAYGDELILVTTDRLSAFDRILGVVPYKGQVLNQLAAFWFGETADIIANHLIATPDPNVTIARPCHPLPVEVVVRGYITGVTTTSLWQQYRQGARQLYGYTFPEGLRKNDPLSAPLITPTTKDQTGGHDQPLTSADVVALGLMTGEQWAQVSDAAVAIFQRGQAVAERAGLILVDTKYEFGVDTNGNVVLIDEVHTPDSSRFWLADTYAERHAAGAEPDNFDKEFIRRHYADQGYRGAGDPPPLPETLAVQAAERYIHIYELLTGQPFAPGQLPAGPRIERNLRAWYGV